MAVRPIRLYGDPVLRKRAQPVGTITPAIRTLVDDMIETMVEANGIGLAAQQVGELVRVFVIDLSAVQDGQQPMGFINPTIIKQEGEQVGDEGCLSFPDFTEKVVRVERATVAAFDLNGQRFELEGAGLLARALLHEQDHLDGVLFIDRLSPIRRRLLQGRLRKLAKSTEQGMEKQ
ncbi:MAG: peptide deformylase [Candidatus Latescibacteria bacterium]|nr:peptide deformylase [Candidatus Latescibacterota bacterium]